MTGQLFIFLTKMTTPSAPRWRRLPEERPQQILAAALQVFDENGLAGARLEDIAKRAGVSKGTIYLYFPNKEELFREVVRSCIAEALEYGVKIPRGKSATEQLRAFMEGFWHFVRSPNYVTISRLVMGELHQFPELAKFYANDVILRARRFIARIVKRGIATGEFRNIDPVVAARMLTALFGAKALWCRKRHIFSHMEHVTDEEVFDQLVDFYLHALRACPQQ
jgi:AcrR family transcriptional regulator